MTGSLTGNAPIAKLPGIVLLKNLRKYLDMLKIDIEHLRQKDLTDVLAIEEEAHDYPWSAGDFNKHAMHLSTRQFTATVDGEIVGYIAINTDRERVRTIENIAVRKDMRRKGIATYLVKETCDFFPEEFDIVQAMVNETNDVAIGFFSKGIGCKAVLVKEPYEEIDRDGYLFSRFWNGDRELVEAN